jgi:hypothetical protein
MLSKCTDKDATSDKSKLFRRSCNFRIHSNDGEPANIEKELHYFLFVGIWPSYRKASCRVDSMVSLLVAATLP